MDALPFAKVVKSVVTAVVINAGMKFSEKQPENIYPILVTFCVLNNGTDCKEEQPENIYPIFVTF